MVRPSQLRGQLTVPSSKSHTLRAILFAALADGNSEIQQYLPSPDTEAIIRAVRQMGARVEVFSDRLNIEGGILHAAEDVIDCGNSGQVLRFVGAVASLLPHYSVFTGDASIRNRRPVQPLLEGLNQLGAFAVSTRQNGQAPLVVRGPWTKRRAQIEGTDSQPVSGLLIAGAFAPQGIELEVSCPGETPWVDLTLDWLKRFGISYTARNHTHYTLQGGAQIQGFDYRVPGDFSSAAFPIAAALLSGRELTLHNLDLEDVQGDKKVIDLLEKMGARFERHPRSLTVRAGSELKGIEIDVNDCIDALPILAVIGCFAKGATKLFNGAVARLKESDRIRGIALELKKMGAKIEELPDGLVIEQAPLFGALLQTHHDHRLGLALTVAALNASGPSRIRGVECIAKSYPHFQTDFQSIGANLE